MTTAPINFPSRRSGSDLDHDTRVEGSAGRYTAMLSPAWEIWGPNGGYLASVAMRAAGAEAKIPTPASFYAQFLRVARFDRVDAEVTVVQQGRRAESIRVSMSQDGKPILEGLLRTALPGDGLDHHVYASPQVPSPESLPTWEDLWNPGARQHPFWANIEGRVLRPERFQAEPPVGDPTWLEWYRFRPTATFRDPFADAARSLILIDTLGWPAVWRRHPNPPYRAPSLDVMAFFHAPIAGSEWLLCEQACPIGQHGLLGTQARIYDREGRLVASGGSQLLCVPVKR